MKKFLSEARILSSLSSLLALTIALGCIYAAQWQFDRGQIQSDINQIIAKNLERDPLTPNQINDLDPIKNQWRSIVLTGNFIADKQELVRNRYSEGKYGFEVLALFKSDLNRNFWVNRGWVAAGPNASTPPEVPVLTNESIQITARIRSENLSRQLQGSFFVTRAPKDKPTSISNLQGISAAKYYLDLITSSREAVKPLTQILTPQLATGPHFAYAIQWLAFAFLALLGRYLLFRERKRLALK